MTRVWLKDWEWACCGDPFAVGDDVDFGIETRDPSLILAETLGPALVVTVDAIESHHEAEFTDRVRGRVTAVHAVTHEVVERQRYAAPVMAPHLPHRCRLMAKSGRRRGMTWGMACSSGSSPSRYLIEVVPSGFGRA